MTTVRRTAALARAEAVLLRRNPTALIGALLMPVLLGGLPALGSDAPTAIRFGVEAQTVIGLCLFALTIGVFATVVATLVARREEFVLKRLRTGQAGDLEILLGTSASAVLIAWAQIAIGLAIGFWFLDLRAVSNPGYLVVAVLLGSVVCVLLAAAVTVVTSSVSAAQLTGMPVLLLSLFLSGAVIPIDDLPPLGQQAVPFLPMTAVVSLFRLGLTGTTASGSSVDRAGSLGLAALAVGVLLVWTVVLGALVRRWFRWEPRR